MKRILTLLLAAVLLLLPLMPAARAANENMSFLFELSVDGKAKRTVESGDQITLTFTLKRSDGDASAAYAMYAMQNEIRYDSDFFRLVEDSVWTRSGVKTTDIGLTDGSSRELYMNYVNEKGGERWNGVTVVGTCRFQVIGESGSSTIRCQDYMITSADGATHYPATCQDVTITVGSSTEPTPSPSPSPSGKTYTVSFRANGGSTVQTQTVEEGAGVTRPVNPTRSGYTFQGWYKNAALTQPWDFDSDVITANTTLYAKWSRNTGGTGGGTGGGTAATPRPSASPSPSPSPSASPSPSVKPSASPSPSLSPSPSPSPDSGGEKVPGSAGGDRVLDAGVHGNWAHGFFCLFCWPWWMWLLLILLLLLALLLVLLLVLGRTVCFESSGGTQIKSQKIRPGGKVRRPQEPTKPGCVFAGWFRDELLTRRWDFEEDKVEEDMSLYAKWL